MKKKILATAALVCALSTACIFGATACSKKDDGNGDNGGGEVTQAQWTAAFEKTLTARNSTAVIEEEHSGIAKVTHEIHLDLLNKTRYCSYDEIGGNWYKEYSWVEGTSLYTFTQLTADTDFYERKEVSVYANDDSLRNLPFEGFIFTGIAFESNFTKGSASGKLSEMYSSFEYDAENKCYVLSGATNETVYDTSVSTVTVKIENQAVTYVALEQGQSDKIIISYKDFGTTTVTVPNDAKNAPLTSDGN